MFPGEDGASHGLPGATGETTAIKVVRAADEVDGGVVGAQSFEFVEQGTSEVALPEADVRPGESGAGLGVDAELVDGALVDTDEFEVPSGSEVDALDLVGPAVDIIAAKKRGRRCLDPAEYLAEAFEFVL